MNALPALETYDADSELFRFSFPAMGTENVFLLGGADEATLKAAAQEGYSIVDRLEEKLSKFLPESDVSLIARSAAGSPVRVGDDTFHVLELAREAWELTGGVFDPTVAPLLKAWGFIDLEARVPDDAEIARLRESRGMDRVVLDRDGSTVTLERPGIELDLGGIGKGYAADRVVEEMRRRGVGCGAIVLGRSTIVVWGCPPEGGRWRVVIAHPERRDDTIATLDVTPGVLSSSSAAERHLKSGGKTYGHVLDPRTGRPSATPVRSTTVWTNAGVLGDVLSTSLFILGESALAPGGCAEALARKWASELRVGAFLVTESTESWGGLATSTRFLGAPTFGVTE